MKLSKSGFSSKEFLTVIIIVCMILVVMVPTILNAIEFSGKKVLMNNVITFRNEVDKTLLSESLEGKRFNDGCYYITKEGNVCLGEYDKIDGSCNSELLKIELSGNKPIAGLLNIKENKVSNIHNIRIENLFVNVNNESDYYVSEEPQAQMICKP